MRTAKNHAEAVAIDPTVSESTQQAYRDAKFGKSWFARFKARHGLKWRRLSGLRASITPQTHERITEFRQMINALDVHPSRIYNVDETALFVHLMARNSYNLPNDDASGSSQSKTRFTVMLGANWDASDRFCIIIGKSKTPRNTNTAFWERLGCKYYSNKTAWMTQDIFRRFLIDFDSRMTQTVYLVIDNCSGHFPIMRPPLTHVKLLQMPPNATAVLQPMDAGIIRAFKSYYSKLFIHSANEERRAGHFSIKNYPFARVAPWIVEAFKMVSCDTIQNCFRKAFGGQEVEENELELTETEQNLIDIEGDVGEFSSHLLSRAQISGLVFANASQAEPQTEDEPDLNRESSPEPSFSHDSALY
ncbi:MAG: hypothetical protein ACRC9E_07025, partial [Plesiomonas shigelloides]